MTVLTASLSVEELLELGGQVIVEGLSFDQFQKLAEQHPELRMEQETNGNIYIMTPVKGGSGYRENNLSYYLTDWSKKGGGGMIFSASTGFKLPDGSTKSPDIAWINQEAIKQLPSEELEGKFVPIVPDFVAEIRSKSDPIHKLIQKMKDSWIANGVKLAWLIDPYDEIAYIYRADGFTEQIKGFQGNRLSGEGILEGFTLELSDFRLLTRR